MGPALSSARAELAALRWGPVAGVVALAAGLMVLDLWVLTGGPGTSLLWLAAALLGGAASLALDDPTGDLADATPTSRRLRSGARAVVLVAGLAGWTAYAGLVTHETTRLGGTVSWTALTLIGGAVVLSGFAAGAVLCRTGTTEPGAVVGPALLALVVGLFLLPLPWDFEPYDISTTWTAAMVVWTVIGAGCLLTIGAVTADPRAGFTRHRGHGGPARARLP